MPTVGEIFNRLALRAPLERKMSFDNVGLLAGSYEWSVDKVMLALDITEDVIAQAGACGAGLIISHHPLFFKLNAVNERSSEGRRLLSLLTGKIAAVCMHTNLDVAEGGVNDALAEVLRLRSPVPFEPEQVCRIGWREHEETLAEFLPTLREALHCRGLRYVDGGKCVYHVAVGGGSCGNMLEQAAIAGCDTFITADVKHDVFLQAKELGVNLIDAGHFNTENVVIPVLEKWLRADFPNLEIRLAEQSQPEQYA